MKRILAFLLALTMAAGLAACSQTAESTESTEPATMAPMEPVKTTIHVLQPATIEGWEGAANMQATAAIDAIKEAGKYEVVTDVYGSVEQQREILAKIAAESKGDGAQAVVTMPLSEELDDVFAELLEANVPFALADLIPAGAEGASVTNVRYDQHAMGAAVAAWLVQNGLTQEDKVLIIQGINEAEAQRTEGFQMYLQGKLAHEGVTIETPWESLDNIVYSDMQGATREGAEAYFQSYMESADHASTKYIAAWDDAYVLGVLDALEGENIDSSIKSAFLSGMPFIAGCGGSQAMLDVLAGTSAYTNLTALGGIQTVVCATDLLKTAVETMAAHLDGSVVEQDQTQPITWATVENASQFKGYEGMYKGYKI